MIMKLTASREIKRRRLSRMCVGLCKVQAVRPGRTRTIPCAARAWFSLNHPPSASSAGSLANLNLLTSSTATSKGCPINEKRKATVRQKFCVTLLLFREKHEKEFYRCLNTTKSHNTAEYSFFKHEKMN